MAATSTRDPTAKLENKKVNTLGMTADEGQAEISPRHGPIIGIPDVLPRVLSGSIGAIATAFAVTPLEVVKVRQQAMTVPLSHSYSGLKPNIKPPTPPLGSYITCGTPTVLNKGVVDGGIASPCSAGESKKKSSTSSAQKASMSHHHHHCRRRIASAAIGFGTKTNSTTIDRGILSVFRHVYRTEGVAGLYSGIYPTLLTSIPSAVLYFTAYDEFSHRLREGWSEHRRQYVLSGDEYPTKNDGDNNDPFESIGIPLLAGSSARVLATVATSPLEVVRIRQAGGVVGSGSLWNEFSVLFRPNSTTRGRVGIGSGNIPSSLFLGLGPTLWRDVPFSAVYWLGVETIRSFLREEYECRNPGVDMGPSDIALHSFLSGAVSGMVASAVATPFDVVKTRIQVGGGSETEVGRTKTTLRLLRHIARTEGVRGLWRGNVARMAKAAPACAIMISCYELGKLLLTQR